MTTGGRLQPGYMMKFLEAERWQKSANPHEVALLQQQQEEDKIGSTTTQETKSASYKAVRSLGRVALRRIPPANAGAPHTEARKAVGRDECKRSEARLLPEG
jgi:molecular chaperone DnaK (HSP70)